MSFFGVALTVFLKDLRLEARTGGVVLSTALFALLVVVLAAFAFGLNTLPGADASAGVFWIAVAFAGVLALGRAFAVEREFDVWTALLLTPAPRAALYLGKVLSVIAFLLVVEAVILPVIQLFFHASLLGRLGQLAPILLLANLGFAAAGTLFGALSIRTRLRDLLLGVILFPLVAPVLIAAVKATSVVVAGQGLGGATDYLGLLAIFDVLFLVGGLWLFGPLMED